MPRKRNDITGQFTCTGLYDHSVKVRNPADLPKEFGCYQCDLTKPLEEMCVVHLKKEGVYYVRPRCKECHNENERGHRREWKTKYLQGWRKRNKTLADSYWQDDPDRKEKGRTIAARCRAKDKDAIAIKRRLWNQLGQRIYIVEARELLQRFGPCFPSRYGLTEEGLRQVERLRKKPIHKRLSMTALRIMAYEDGLFIKPERQPVPYQASAENLRRWHQQQKQLKAAA